MRRAYVDANVIVRLITNDPEDMADCAARLFEQVDEGALELVIDGIVLAETVWVLSSFYGFSAHEIAPGLATLLTNDGIVSEDKTELLQALALYDKKNIDFVDALVAVRMLKRGISEVYSFDRHFDRLQSISRIQPN